MKKTRKIKVPVDRGASAMIANNKLPDAKGTITFALDGWIKDSNGKKLKKWFGTIGGYGNRYRVWEPKLDDISAIEAVMWRCYTKVREDFEKGAWFRVWEEIKEHDIKKAYFQGSKGEWGYIEFNNDPQMGWTYGLHWVASEARLNPNYHRETPYNTTFYKRFAEANKRYTTLLNRKSIAAEFFHAAMNRKLYEMRPKQMKELGKLLKVTVNGRNYWYVAAAYEGSSVMYWKFMYDYTNKPQVLKIS